MRSSETQIPAIALTRIQETIVELVAHGAKNEEIAELTGLSHYTVKNYVRDLFDKLGVWSRVELALWYEKRRVQQLGLLD